jgi:hypothetical protein
MRDTVVVERRPGARVMRVGTPFEQWRVAEQALKAIEARIAGLGAPGTLSLARLDELLILRRAHIRAARRADELWQRHRQDFEKSTDPKSG